MQALITLIDGTVLTAEEQEYYDMLEARENEPETYAQAIGLDDYDVEGDR